MARPRLIARLDEGLKPGHKLTLVCAPAGYGKSTLVAAWLKRLSGSERVSAEDSRPMRQGGVAWLSLDVDDNDLSRFFVYLLAALQQIEPHLGASLAGIENAPQLPPLGVLLPPLINDIAAREAPCVLVLDDYHLLTDQQIHEALTFLIEHAPPSLHLVIISREEPPLLLSRWRARGQLLEIRQADLRFTGEEISQLLQSTLDREITPHHVAALESRTEGWIAGLQLVALSMQALTPEDEISHFVARFASSNRYILDYLADEVLRQRPQGTRDFLLQTSVLRRFSASLCEAVTGQPDARGTLARLERANLFIVPLDEAGNWLRYHHLFADLLQHRLNLTDIDKAELHQRASDWYHDHELLSDAIHHALAARDWGSAVPLLLRIGGAMLNSGQITTYLEWLQKLPEEILLSQATLCLVYGWALARTEQLEAAAAYFDRAEAGATDLPFLLGRVVVGKAHVARALGQVQEAITLSEKALALLPEEDLEQRSIAGLNLGIAHWSRGDLQTAEAALVAAYDAGRQSDTVTVAITALCFRARVLATYGRLQAAAELYRQAILLGEEGRLSPSIGLAQADLAALCYEWNQLDTALAHADRGMHFSQFSGDIQVQISSLRALAQIRQAQGEMAAAEAILLRLHDISELFSVPERTRIENAAYQVALALRQGTPIADSRWLEMIAAAPLTSTPSLRPRLTEAQYLLARGEIASLNTLLESLHTAVAATNRNAELIAIRALQALGAPAPDEALRLLTEALRLAQPEGFIRSFVDLGDPLRELLGAFIARRPGPDTLKTYALMLRAAFDRPAPDTPPIPPADPPQPDAVLLPDPLSERELEVLGLVATGLSNREVAEELFISVNTVRTHLRRIYVKLDVHGRLAAVNKAQQLQIL